MKKNLGLSMVEVMIGVILLALMVIPSLNVITSKTRTVTATRDHSQAAFVAQKVQETARAFKFDLIESDQYSSDPQMQKKTYEWKLKNEDDFRRHNLNGIEYLIDEVAIDPAVNKEDPDTNQSVILLLFKFTVKYTGKDGRDHSLRINTAISRRG